MQQSTAHAKYIVVETNVGNDIGDILNAASEVQIDGSWYPVLGYDTSDDILCLDGQDWRDDLIIREASKYVTHTEVMVSMKVFEN